MLLLEVNGWKLEPIGTVGAAGVGTVGAGVVGVVGAVGVGVPLNGAVTVE
jgi:hypothetical protein